MTAIFLRRIGIALAISAATEGGLASAAPTNVPQPQLDLGQTSFLDGEAGRGGLFEVILDANIDNDVRDAQGRRLAGSNRLRTGSVIIHSAYVSGIDLLGGDLGIEALLPLTTVRSSMAGEASQSRTGFGDITLAPFVQWSHGSLLGRPLSVRLAAQVVTPTGGYTADRSLNPGQNGWQLSPYLAATWRTSRRFEISGRAIYDWSGRNNDPGGAYMVRSIQPGPQIAIDLSASRALGTSWRIGASGYMLQQIGDAKFGGLRVSAGRERAFGLGPGVLFQSGKTRLIWTAYREFANRDRPMGSQIVLRLLQPL